MADDKYLETDTPATKPGLQFQNGLESDPDMDGLTLYEKKALLVNRELDAHGMGKYQWYIWFLCGFGYMLDLLWAQAFGLVAAPLQQELGFSGAHAPCSSGAFIVLRTYISSDAELGNIFVSFSAGLTAGVNNLFWMVAPGQQS